MHLSNFEECDKRVDSHHTADVARKLGVDIVQTTAYGSIDCIMTRKKMNATRVSSDCSPAEEDFRE